ALLGMRHSVGQTVSKPADSILVNGNIIKVDSKFTSAQALAIADGKILAVGSAEEIRKFVGPQTRRIDLHGKTVVPGLIDDRPHDDGQWKDRLSAQGVSDLKSEIQNLKLDCSKLRSPIQDFGFEIRLGPSSKSYRRTQCQ